MPRDVPFDCGRRRAPLPLAVFGVAVFVVAFLFGRLHAPLWYPAIATLAIWLVRVTSKIEGLP